MKLTRVGVDGTDKEINAAEYGAPPPGDEFLNLGHESFGRVEAVGPNVTEFEPGDYVVASVRRPGMSLYDKIGLQDMTTDDTYFERGINLLHGYLAEYYADSADYIVRVPKGLSEVGSPAGTEQRGREGDWAGVRSAAPVASVAAEARGSSRRWNARDCWRHYFSACAGFKSLRLALQSRLI